MKKIISLALAAAMVAGMSMTSFATANAPKVDNIVFGDGVKPAVEAFMVEDGVVSKTAVNDLKGLNPGDKVAIKLMKTLTVTAVAPVAVDTIGEPSAKDIKGWKLKGTWDINMGDIVNEIKIEKLMKEDGGVTGFGYYATVSIKESTAVKSYDLVGTLTLYKTSTTNYSDKVYLGDNAYATAGFKTKLLTDDSTVYAEDTDDNAPVMKFTKAGEETIEFDGIGLFEINVQGQNSLYLSFNTKANMDVINKYDEANLEFVNFPGTPKFYRTGIFYLYNDVDADQYLYKMVDGVISPVEGTYNEEMEAFKFALKNFPQSFIVSDVELDLEAATEAPETPEVGKENPSTGR